MSVPSAKVHRPAATATAEPQEEPPGEKRSSNALAAEQGRTGDEEHTQMTV